MTVRAKFRVNSVRKVADYYNKQNVMEVQLFPVSGDPIFGKATPTGNLNMTVTPEGTQKFFEDNLGKEVYIDISIVE